MSTEPHALVFEAVRQMRWRPWARPAPAPGWALLRTRATGICGSDIHGYLGESGRRTPPLVMGHEAVGVVEEVGWPSDRHLIGQRCCVQPIVFCGDCAECRGGSPQHCEHRQFLGGTRDGAMGDYFTAPASALFPVPETLDNVTATLAEPAAVALHAVAQAGDLRGKAALVCGAGAIGLLIALAARRAGATHVVATDIDPFHRATAEKLGIDRVIDPAAAGRDALPLGNERCDVAFDAVGISATYNAALRSVRRRGRVVAVGGWTTVETPLNPLVAGELTVVGTFNYTPNEFSTALQWLAAREFDLSLFVTQLRALAEGAAVFEQLSARNLKSIRTVLVPAA